MSTLVMKFGGSSVGTPGALTQVLSIVLHEYEHRNNLILVASALDGVTDMLLEAAYLAQVSNQRGYRRIAATLRTRHLAIVEQLPLGTSERMTLQADVDRLLFEMLDTCQSVANTTSETLAPHIVDSIVSVGERISARIIAGLLRQNNLLSVAIDGMDLLVTDAVHGNATPNIKLTEHKVSQLLLPMLARNIVPVVTGFIGATPDGKTTTLGRGGSDYTASVLAICTHAEEVWIWSNVDGMMSTDPNEISTAVPIEELSYNEAAELAYFGARILHARMILPLKERNIPLRIKNVYKPQLEGTRIHHLQDKANPPFKAVTSIHAIGLSAPRSGSLASIAQLVDEALFKSIGAHADVMISSQSSSQTFLCFVVPTSAGLEAIGTIRSALQERLTQYHDEVAWQVRPLSVVTAISQNLEKVQRLAAQMLTALEGIPLLGVVQGPSGCSLSFIVEPAYTEDTLHRIHRLIVKNEQDSSQAPKP
jgi:aspartate kinase